jgi:DNA-binding response OmpR family regulator
MSAPLATRARSVAATVRGVAIGLAAVAALGAPVLAKPFTPDELDAAVRAAARRTPPAAVGS